MEFNNYIAGKWVNGRNGKIFDTINPANEEVIAHIHATDVTDVETAVEAAVEVHLRGLFG